MSELAVRFDDRITKSESNIVSLYQRKIKKDGTPKNIKSNAQKGKKSEVFYFKIDDANKILHYFEDKEMWLHYLLFALSVNLARRNGDMRGLKWKHFFNTENGEYRDSMLEIKEEKTGKFANPHISKAVRNAINLYCEKTGCVPSENAYENPVCLQLSGNYKGRVLSYDGCRKAIKKAAEAVGITYNVGTHSCRKTFGATAMQLHPQDPRILETVSGIYNHSNTRVTEAYTNRTKECVDDLHDEIGDCFDRYIAGDESFSVASNSPVVSLNSADLRTILQLAYEAGRDNAGATDAMIHVDTFANIMAMVEQVIK